MKIFWELLGVAFIVLKLTHHINWSWWLVLSPVICIAFVVILKAIFVSKPKPKTFKEALDEKLKNRVNGK